MIFGCNCWICLIYSGWLIFFGVNMGKFKFVVILVIEEKKWFLLGELVWVNIVWIL